MFWNAMSARRCCTLFVGGVVSGVYTTAAYLAAFCMEVGWIVDNEGDLPAPSYVLSAIYISTLLVSAILLIGIAKKKTRFLLIWLFFMGISFLPECGLVLYMALRYWKLDNERNINGVTELTFYIFRAVINVLAFVSIQSLLRRWKQEKAVMRRLEFLNIGPVYRDTNGGGSHHIKTDNNDLSMISNGGGGYANPIPIDSDLLNSNSSKQHLSRSPSNISRHLQSSKVSFGAANGTTKVPASPRDIFNARAAYWNTSKSEFDAASFVDFINNRPRPVSELGLSRMSSGSHNELPTSLFSLEGGWSNGQPGTGAYTHYPTTEAMGYATQSLERPKFRNQPFGRRSKSLEDISGPLKNPAEVTLEKIQDQPFHYLNRPGAAVYRDESDDISDTHSIRDIAL